MTRRTGNSESAGESGRSVRATRFRSSARFSLIHRAMDRTGHAGAPIPTWSRCGRRQSVTPVGGTAVARLSRGDRRGECADHLRRSRIVGSPRRGGAAAGHETGCADKRPGARHPSVHSIHLNFSLRHYRCVLGFSYQVTTAPPYDLEAKEAQRAYPCGPAVRGKVRPLRIVLRKSYRTLTIADPPPIAFDNPLRIPEISSESDACHE
jgi:hypothetical protein